MAFANGEKFASDSGCHHLAHAAWNLFALMQLNYPGESHDPELFNKMIEYWEKKKRDTSEQPKDDIKFILEEAEKLQSFREMEAKYCGNILRKLSECEITEDGSVV
jgi:hypothetical protein